MMPRLRQVAGGYTLIELLVVIALVVLLIALLLPVVQSARKAAQAAQCTTQQRSIGVATLNYSVENRGYFPLAFYASVISPSQHEEAIWPATIEYQQYLQFDPKSKSWDGPFMCPTYARDGIVPRSTIAAAVAPNCSYTVSRGLGQYSYHYNTPDESVWLRKPTTIRRLGRPANTAWLIDGIQRNTTRLQYAGDPEILIHGYLPFSGAMNRHQGGVNNLLFVDGHVQQMKGESISDQAIRLWSFGS